MNKTGESFTFNQRNFPLFFPHCSHPFITRLSQRIQLGYMIFSTCIFIYAYWFCLMSRYPVSRIVVFFNIVKIRLKNVWFDFLYTRPMHLNLNNDCKAYKYLMRKIIIGVDGFCLFFFIILFSVFVVLFFPSLSKFVAISVIVMICITNDILQLENVMQCF